MWAWRDSNALDWSDGMIEGFPIWLHPVEAMSADAIAMACDADRRDVSQLEHTLVIKLTPTV